MILTLKNFGTWKEHTITFSNTITTLSGHSGYGKTTIIRAVIWCLYGEFPMTTTNTKVTITLDYMTISRMTNPQRLELVTNNVTLLKTEAQNYINDYFGSYSVWMACNCVMQAANNELISLSNKEKMSVIKEMINSNHSSDFINWLSNQYTLLDKEYSTECLSLDHKLKKFTTKYHEMGPEYDTGRIVDYLSITPKLSKSRIAKIETSLAKKIELVNQLNNKIIIRDQTNSLLLKQEQELEQLQQQLPKYDGFSPIDDARFALEKQSLINKQRYNDHLKTIHTCFSPDYLDQLKKLEQENTRYHTVIRKYRVSNLTAHCQKLRTLLDSQSTDLARKRELCKQIKAYREQLGPILTPVKPLPYEYDSAPDYERLRSLSNKISQNRIMITNYKKQLEIRFVCPKCQSAIGLHDNHLVDLEVAKEQITVLAQEQEQLQNQYDLLLRTVKDNSAKIESYRKAVSDYERQLRESEKRAKLLATIEQLEAEDSAITVVDYGQQLLSITEIRKYTVELEELESITYNRLEYSSSFVEQCLSLQPYAKLQCYPSMEVLVSDHKRSSDYYRLSGRVKVLQQFIIELRNELEKVAHPVSYRDCNYKLDELKAYLQQQIDHGQQLVVSSKKRLEIEQDHKSITKQQRLTNHLFEQLQSCKQLMTEANALEHDMIKSFCSDVSLSINELSQEIFKSGIKFTLSTSKYIKSTKQTKTLINMECTIGSHHHPKIYPSTISGGELNRLSILLTIVLTKYSRFPFIFFDEKFNAIDSVTADKVMQLLEKQQKGVVITCHE